MTKVQWFNTFKVWWFTACKAPMAFWLRPRIVVMTDQQATIEVPFCRRTKNYLHSMIGGALLFGGELTAIMLISHLIRPETKNFPFILKDFHATFLKRAEANVHFTCADGDIIKETIAKVRETKERHSIPVEVIATVPSLFGDDPIARFSCVFSMKYQAPQR
jgi:hypothetical protein